MKRISMSSICLYIGACFSPMLLTNCSDDQQQVQEQVEQGEQGENGYGEGEGEGNGADGYGNYGAESATANAYQAQEATTGEGLNNSTIDDYAEDLTAQTASPALDAAIPPGEQAIQEAPSPASQATFMPGEIPPGWARTQNGLYVNMSNLSDQPLGYAEPPAMWK